MLLPEVNGCEEADDNIAEVEDADDGIEVESSGLENHTPTVCRFELTSPNPCNINPVP